jgi:hypothetical protein
VVPQCSNLLHDCRHPTVRGTTKGGDLAAVPHLGGTQLGGQAGDLTTEGPDGRNRGALRAGVVNERATGAALRHGLGLRQDGFDQ